LTKFDLGLLRLHEADEAAIDWLTSWFLAHDNNNNNNNNNSGLVQTVVGEFWSIFGVLGCVTSNR